MATILDQFLGGESNGYYPCDGQHVLLKDFLADFYRYIARRRMKPESWPIKEIITGLGPSHPVGYGPRNQRIVGNLSKFFRRPPRWIATENGQVRLEREPAGKFVIESN